MIKSRFGWSLIAQVLMLALPVMAQQPRQSEIAAAAQIYGYNMAEGNWIASPAPCAAMSDFVMFHYLRRYPDGAESNFTAIVPRSFGHVHIVPVLYHGATPFVSAPGNPRNLTLFNSLDPPRNASGPDSENRWLERASCYAEMTGGNDFLAASAIPKIAGQPSPTLGLTLQGKTARVLFAERDSDHSYRVWDLLFSREGKIKSAQTQEQSLYGSRIARRRGNAESPAATTAAVGPAKESARWPRIATSQPQQRASIEAEQRAPLAAISPNSSNAFQSTGSQTAGAQAAQPGWKLILNPPQPPSKFVPNAPLPPGTTVPNPPSNPR